MPLGALVASQENRPVLRGSSPKFFAERGESSQGPWGLLTSGWVRGCRTPPCEAHGGVLSTGPSRTGSQEQKTTGFARGRRRSGGRSSLACHGGGLFVAPRGSASEDRVGRSLSSLSPWLQVPNARLRWWVQQIYIIIFSTYIYNKI